MASVDSVVWCHATPVPIASGVFEEHQEPRSLIRFSGPIREEWKEALASRGIRVEFWAPPFGACVTLPDDLKPGGLRAFPFLEGAVAYRQEQCRRDVPAHSEMQRIATGMPDDQIDVVCFGREVRARVEEQLRTLGIPILAISSSKIRVQYSGDLAVLRDLEGVKIADHARAPVLLGAQPAASAMPSTPTLPAGLDGRGEIIAVADTGLDIGVDDPRLHRDFQGRVELIANWPPNPSWAQVLTHPNLDDGAADRNSGHGTHIAGLSVGDGSTGGGVHPGAAPAARLVFQAMEHYCETKSPGNIPSGYYLCGRPLDLRELFQQASDRGARIHVNSWGDPAQGAYTDDCFETDLFLHEHPEAVVLFAAGNDGADRTGSP